ncbi:MAG: hypothetical protein ACLUKO_22545 [Enterocloster bolteae]
MKTIRLNPIDFGTASLKELDGMTVINMLEQEFQGRKFVLLTFWGETANEFKKLQIWDDGELQVSEVYDLTSIE